MRHFDGRDRDAVVRRAALSPETERGNVFRRRERVGQDRAGGDAAHLHPAGDIPVPKR